jgi:DNA segregation ATPase FtsK/SpoIIIE-like protein
MKTLSEFGIPATVIGYRVGPSVTQFAVFSPASSKGPAPMKKMRSR